MLNSSKALSLFSRPVMKAATALIVANLAICEPSQAQTQTTRCYWVGNVWTCDQSQPIQQRPQPDFSTLNNPANVGNSVMDGFRRGQQLGEALRRGEEQRERERLEQDRLKAETEFYRSQATQQQAGRSEQQVGTQAPSLAPHVQQWLVAAQPRMHLFPDFDEKVFAPDAPISERMVLLMSESAYAADIAYYLATNRGEALAISSMTILDAGEAIRGIETRMAAKETDSVGQNVGK